MRERDERHRKAAAFLDWLQITERTDPRVFRSGRLDASALIELALSAIAYAEIGCERVGCRRFFPTLACRKGCSYCCRLPLMATVPELLGALEYARRRCTEADLRRMQERATQFRVRVRTGGLQAGGACPFLLDEECTVYAARPLACRGWTSRDVDMCREAIECGPHTVRVPVNGIIRRVYANAGEALARGLARLGLDPIVQLGPAVSVTLSGTDEGTAVERWLAGERFLSAS